MPTWKESENLILRVVKSGGLTPQPVTKVPRRGESPNGALPGIFLILPQQMLASGDRLVMSFYDYQYERMIVKLIVSSLS